MIRVKTALAATVALAACVNAGFAADTNAPVALDSPKLSAASGKAKFAHSWYGSGADGGTGYYNPALYEYNPYPYYNIVGGETYDPLYVFDLPDQNESPFNPPAALAHHGVTPTRSTYNSSSPSIAKKAAPAVPPSAVQDAH